MQDLIVIAQVFAKIFMNFVPLTALMLGALWVTLKLVK
jgi:hypothetical protein